MMADRLSAWASGLAKARFDRATLGSRIAFLATPEEYLGEAGWDTTAQLHLGLTALYQANRDDLGQVRHQPEERDERIKGPSTRWEGSLLFLGPPIAPRGSGTGICQETLSM
jgi:hypothetical protein